MFVEQFETPGRVETKPERFTPEHFENWLASMPRAGTYDWLGHCLYKQYGEYCGVVPTFCAYLEATDALKNHTGQRVFGGEPFRFVASERPHTFGAALRRLRIQRHGLIGTATIYFREWVASRALQSTPA